jgi:hypothetical protein
MMIERERKVRTQREERRNAPETERRKGDAKLDAALRNVSAQVSTRRIRPSSARDGVSWV